MPTKLQLLSKKNRLRYANMFQRTDDAGGFQCKHGKTPNYYTKKPAMGYKLPNQKITFKQPRAENADPKVVPEFKKHAKRVRFV